MAINQSKTPETTSVPAAPEAKPDNLVIVDANQLAQTIVAAMAQVMGPLLAQQQQNQNQPFDYAAMGQVIGQAVAGGIAANTRRKVTFGEYDKLGPRNSYHPNDKAHTPTLKRQLWQNDTICHFNTLMDREIELANRITHSGRYYDRKVEVIFDEGGENIYIRYNNKTADQRFELKNNFRSLQELLEHVVKIQEQEDADVKQREEELRAEREARIKAKERHVGGNEAYKAAVAAAEARQ